MKKKKICLIVGISPFFLGGVSLYQKHLLDYIESKKLEMDISVLYSGNEKKVFYKKGVKYVQLKNTFPYPFNQIIDNIKFKSFIQKNDFDIINSHAVWGHWMNSYKRRRNQRILHTYHGITFNFFRNHLRRFNLFKKILCIPLLIFSYYIEKPPLKHADKIVCVSDKVKKQIETLYGKRKNLVVIRTGVDLKKFKVRNKLTLRKKFGLKKDKLYGLYIGGGGYWTKGLDRTIKISEEIYKLNKNYRLIIIGADKKKVNHLIDKKFVIFLNRVPREDISQYHSLADFFFCLSRYEGVAPTMVVSESMASGSLLICSQSAQQEIIKDGENGLIIKNYNKHEAKRILKNRHNKKIISNSKKTIQELSLNNWGKSYLSELLE
ncbi:glycosyltransferase family 4 protein [Candidatus Woesearchaeota archaeon]|nr:glycosyltransferase family 4 protein [Candidatus Woesearchaeota archaeon]